jgi:hypothetical protein
MAPAANPRPGPRSLALIALLAACGEAVDRPNGDAGLDAAAPVDGGPQPDAGAPPDAGPPGPRTVRISGQVLRLDALLEGARLAVGEASVRALGAQGVEAAVSDAVTGDYALTVPPEGKLVLAAARAGYLQSYAELAVADRDVVARDFLMAYEPHVARLTERFGVEWGQDFPCRAPNAGPCRWGLVMGRVVDDGSAAGGAPTPLAGVGAADFTLLGEGDPAWHRQGPYFFFFNGQPAPAATATQRQLDEATGRYRGGLFAFFVEVPVSGPPSRDVELRAASLAGGDERRYFGPLRFKVWREGFTWVDLAETGQPPVEPPAPGGVDFDTQIYPLFFPVAQGGYGCQGCHGARPGPPAAGMDLGGGPAAAYAALDPARYPRRVNLQDPASSLLLVRPLYEAAGPQDHPVFAFVSTEDPAYRLVLAWIREGARRGPAPRPDAGVPPDGDLDAGVPPDAGPPGVSFYRDVRPLLASPVAAGGAGCHGCHVNGVNATNAPGGLYLGGDGRALWTALTQAPARDGSGSGERYRINRAGDIGRSLLLTNPTVGSPEPHPAKLFAGTADPRYQLLYRWISEGYLDDSP